MGHVSNTVNDTDTQKVCLQALNSRGQKEVFIAHTRQEGDCLEAAEHEDQGKEQHHGRGSSSSMGRGAVLQPGRGSEAPTANWI